MHQESDIDFSQVQLAYAGTVPQGLFDQSNLEKNVCVELS